jgi:hypothetical protein
MLREKSLLIAFRPERMQILKMFNNTTIFLASPGCMCIQYTLLSCKPRQWAFYTRPALRANKDAILQPTPLEIVYPCGSPGSHSKRADRFCKLRLILAQGKIVRC